MHISGGISGEGGSGLQYFNRPDPGTEDGDLGTMIVDGNWHDFDISGIVPINAKLLVIQMFAVQSDANKTYFIRAHGDTSTQKSMNLISQSPNSFIGALGVVACDAARIIQYMFTDSGTWYWAEFTIAGWFY